MKIIYLIDQLVVEGHESHYEQRGYVDTQDQAKYITDNCRMIDVPELVSKEREYKYRSVIPFDFSTFQHAE